MKKPPRKKGDHHIEHDDHDNVDYRKSWSWGASCSPAEEVVTLVAAQLATSSDA